MENHRPWRRVVSMFRRRRNSSSRPSVSPRQARLRHRNEVVSNHTPPAPMMSRLFRDIYRSRYSHQLPSHPHTPQLNYGTNWSSLIFTSNALGRNLDKFGDFTPKCLSDINCHELLMGQESYDNFSSSCWLEDHLHHFAEVSEDINETEDGNSDSDNTFLLSGSENFTLVDASRRLPVSEQRLPTVLTRDTFRSDISHGSNSLSVHSSSGLGSRGSTISDVTHFYNNMNLTGFSPNSPLPPPYTETSEEDPPPSYTDVFIPLSEGRRQSNPSRASSSLFQDILW